MLPRHMISSMDIFLSGLRDLDFVPHVHRNVHEHEHTYIPSDSGVNVLVAANHNSETHLFHFRGSGDCG